MEAFGNKELLKRHKIGYFASSKIATLSVLPTLDWASKIAGREDVAVVSGFHSKLEKEVLDYLLRGRCGIICVLSRSLYRKIPAKFLEALHQNRLLFLTEITSPKVSMTSRDAAHKRNLLVAKLSDELVFSSVTPESSLAPIPYLFPTYPTTCF